MNKKLILLSAVAFTFSTGFWVGHFANGRHLEPTKADDSGRRPAMPALPIWKRQDCVAPNAHEISYLERAVSTLEDVPPDSADWLSIGAERALSGELYRRASGSQLDTRVCVPPTFYDRAELAFAGRPLKGLLDSFELRLAAHFDQPPIELVEAVAQIAFAQEPIVDDGIAGKVAGDLRPYARTVLAGFGQRSASYAHRAFEEISGDNSLGTGAAQVAVAAGSREALSRVESMMNQLLDSVPPEQPIPLKARDRLYELSWAIAFSDNSLEHATPVLRLMNRQVESASSFGRLRLPPRRMCEVLERIYAGSQSFTTSFHYCTDGGPLESYPQGAFAFTSIHKSPR